ncbi:STE11 family mitogen-activated protein kinase kinase kinase [Aspergillus affinis]|uniref:STE11 family mitogen-activated protein kinase kinase kinase n=1 Tax=Aspergillus affinis TaxID=1070780 RepID=UPI0022FE703B|nr:serine/threonine protein kinase [Aspergillus affinis]KAI9040233.1 serine/threonine protein kinase [Aspergillus affinis]
MLASKPSYTPLGVPTTQTPTTSYHTGSQKSAVFSNTQDGTLYTSPTESEFTGGQDGLDAVRSWDEKQVVTWLHSINCGQYEPLFRANNFNGNNLIECDQKILQEMGVKKIGDRVRIFVAIKQLRTKSVANRKQRNLNQLASLEASTYASTHDSSRPSLRQQTLNNRRLSRTADTGLHAHSSGRPSSRPGSPLRAQRYAGSPMDAGRKDQGQGYFSHPSSGGSTSGRNPGTPGEGHIHRSASHLRQNPSLDGLMGSLPTNSPVIRVIYTGGQTKVLNIKHCKTADEVILCVLKKLQLPEHQYRNYCFYVLDGLEPNPSNCRRLGDHELMEICEGSHRSERSRLILRKIHAGEPDTDELRRACQLAMDESQLTHLNALNSSNMRNQLKIQQLTGESWHNIKQPMSPVSTRHHQNPSDPELQLLNAERHPVSKLRSFFGARPPSEMIIHEITSYFPSHHREDIEKTMRMSVRRSQRLSRAASRMSVVSNTSYASSLRDAPPIPSIADTWLNPGAQPTRASRPLSVSKFSLPQTAYRDSIASSSLQPLQEESPIEPNRKSYVSFDSGSDDPSNSRQSLLDENASVAATDGGSFNERLSVLVADDGEEEDDGLNDFLTGNNFAPKNWMKGSLIGEGSFGSVFLALHSITGELMAVKQVEIPSATKGTEFDKRKNSMVTALKHEIELLQGMHHPNIVQYLGTSADDQYLNIFLEYVPGGSIATMLKQYNTFQEPLIKNFVRQILSGLSYLHSQDIIHRDIKGANILVDNKGGIKISDFGISKRVEASTVLGSRASGTGAGHLHRPSLQGSVYWMAPEVVRQTAHTKKADIWSLGCLVVEMFIGAHPFPDCSQLQAIFAIGSNKARPPAPESASDDAVAFLDMTFQVDYEQRPSADELLKCQFLTAPLV